MACQVLPFLGAKVLQKLIKPLLSSKSNKEAKGRQYTAVHRKLGKKGMGGKKTPTGSSGNRTPTHSICLAQSRGIRAVLTPLCSVLSPPPPFCDGRQKRPFSVWDHALITAALPHQLFSVSKFNLILLSDNPLYCQSNYHTTNEVPGFGEQKN